VTTGGRGFMENFKDMFRAKTKELALDVIRFTEALPKTRTADIIARQLVRCGMSTSANYRAASRAKSRADFIAKMGIVEEEADETLHWLELLVESGIVKAEDAKPLFEKANKIVAITVSTIKTARRNK
jgi:four helix bundle protein